MFTFYTFSLLPLSGTVVVINIRRLASDRPPVFSRNPYRVDINKYLAVNSLVVATSATDPDIPTLSTRVKYELNSAQDVNFFEINRDTGAITLARSLLLDQFKAAYYTVSKSHLLFSISLSPSLYHITLLTYLLSLSLSYSFPSNYDT